MKTGWIVCFVLLPITGCGLAHQSIQVLSNSTGQALSDHKEKKRNKKWARQAWASAKACSPGQTFSEDYAEGYQQGFTDLLYWGGNGEPPSIAPAKYRTVDYQSRDGYKAIQDWFGGYRHGAWTARQGGYRDWITGPSGEGSASSLVEQIPSPPVPVLNRREPVRAYFVR